jgi:hypothetical protein
MAEQRLPKPTTRIRFPSPAPWRAAVHALALLAMFLAFPASAQYAAPRIASLTIEIWPEYDRPAALVILRGVLAEEVKLPAAMTLRIPAASDGPAAVAYATSVDGNLLNLQHQQSKSGDHVLLKFDLPERFFHVEFYEPIATADAARTFRYTWPGDHAVGRATLTVQEPASAQGMATEPKLEDMSTGGGGLAYRSGDLGALAAGKSMPIAIRYTKSDTRPSVDIKGLRTVQPAAPAAAPAAAASENSTLPAWASPMAAFVALALAAALLVFFLWRRQSAPGSAAFCTKCGHPLPAGSNFCGKCGAKVAAKRG